MSSSLYRLGHAVVGRARLVLAPLGGRAGRPGWTRGRAGRSAPGQPDHPRHRVPAGSRHPRAALPRARRDLGADPVRRPRGPAGAGVRRRDPRRDLEGGRGRARPDRDRSLLLEEPRPLGERERPGRPDPGPARHPAGARGRADRRRPGGRHPASPRLGPERPSRRVDLHQHPGPCECHRGDRRPGGADGPRDHPRLPARGRHADPHRHARCRCRHGRGSLGGRLRRRQRLDADPRADDRPRGRDRLRAVHRVPTSRAAGRRGAGHRVDRTRARHRRQRRHLRRHHRGDRPVRSRGGADPLPRRDGVRRRGGRRHRSGRGTDGRARAALAGR